ncbi:MAG: VCBS repeat-containing protein [Sphingobacterium sp.]|nr:VCBS repeat-containing protein [Sphingobacterium sp.]
MSENVFSAVTDTAWQIAGTGDFNGDQQTDILWRYYGTGPYQGLNVVWHMNGATFLSENVLSAVTETAWQIAGTGDFNGDQQTDILWRYYGAGSYQGLNVIWYHERGCVRQRRGLRARLRTRIGG